MNISSVEYPTFSVKKSPSSPREKLPGREAASLSEQIKKEACHSCASRKYKDVSNDPGVSMKTPTNLSPQAAASAVRAHEQEHVVRNQAKAQREDRRILSQTVTLHSAICGECGAHYISGGTTRTVTAGKSELPSPSENQRSNPATDPNQTQTKNPYQMALGSAQERGLPPSGKLLDMRA